jgi:conjugal transfer pilus assembly protein TraK
VVGERYRLVNASGSIMRLAEAELYRDGVHAVAIEQRTLAPGESTPVYIVRTRGETE